MFDYHMHSAISSDSDEEMEVMCEYAVKRGLKEICFTEHLDIDYPYSEITFLPDLNLYDETIKKAREKYTALTIRQGIEIGLLEGIVNAAAGIVKEKGFDFVIASQHIIKGEDPYFGVFFEHYNKKEAFTAYLIELLNNLKLFDMYSVVGHIGYLCKCCPYEDKTLRYADYSDIIEEILKYVIGKGKGLEVNTSSFKRAGVDMPDKSILKRYRELNGEIITFGSDSHARERVGDGYARVISYLKELGFKYICTFEKMKPSFIKI